MNNPEQWKQGLIQQAKKYWENLDALEYAMLIYTHPNTLYQYNSIMCGINVLDVMYRLGYTQKTPRLPDLERLLQKTTEEILKMLLSVTITWTVFVYDELLDDTDTTDQQREIKDQMLNSSAKNFFLLPIASLSEHLHSDIHLEDIGNQDSITYLLSLQQSNSIGYENSDMRDRCFRAIEQLKIQKPRTI